MANPAQEEVDRLFQQKERLTSHPEDRRNSASDSDEEDIKNSGIESTSHANSLDGSDNDEARNMSTLTTKKNTFQLPSTVSHANTGPKGVIADAQDYARAKSSFKRTLNGLGDRFSKIGRSREKETAKSKKVSSSIRAGGDEEEAGDDDDDLLNGDDDFMQRWRRDRLAELQSQSNKPQQKQYEVQRQQQQSDQRRTSPSRRTYGIVYPVSAEGYLDAIEHSPPSTTVVVLLHNPDSKQSCAVEDELDMLAYKHQHVRFIKLHYEIADVDLDALAIPALVAYRGGDVCGTISGAAAAVDGDNDDDNNNNNNNLESELTRQGVLRT